MIAAWFGTPVEELGKDELLEVIAHLGKEVQQLREDRDRWRRAGDPLKYLLQEETK